MVGARAGVQGEIAPELRPERARCAQVGVVGMAAVMGQPSIAEIRTLGG
jgi:hypothetical protein